MIQSALLERSPTHVDRYRGHDPSNMDWFLSNYEPITPTYSKKISITIHFIYLLVGEPVPQKGKWPKSIFSIHLEHVQELGPYLVDVVIF